MRLKNSLWMVSLSLILWINAAVADTTATEALKAKLSHFKSMSADFTQLVYDGNGAVLQKSSGQMALQRPGQFRWSIVKPSHQLLVTDGKTLWIYDIGLEQATEQPLDSKTQVSPAQLLSGSVDELSKAFNVTQLAGGSKSRFKLEPRQETNLFQWVELRFDGETLSEMRLLDGLDQQTRLTFSKVKINPSLKAALFHFTPPAGVDVIRQKTR